MPSAPQNATILCVDDYEPILYGWKTLLENEGYRVLTALDSGSAMDIFSSHWVDEVVLDYRLPGTPGDVLARRMKAVRPHIAVLMLSGDDPVPDEKLKAVDAFLFKGGPITVFLSMVKTLLDRLWPTGNTFTIPSASDQTAQNWFLFLHPANRCVLKLPEHCSPGEEVRCEDATRNRSPIRKKLNHFQPFAQSAELV